MLKLFPNISVVLEQISTFKTSVIAELTVTETEECQHCSVNTVRESGIKNVIRFQLIHKQTVIPAVLAGKYESFKM